MVTVESLGFPTVLVEFGDRKKDGGATRLVGSALVLQVKAKRNQA